MAWHLARVATAHRVRLAGFVARCAASAALACWASDALGLSHTVWAAMSALIVSQERIEATRAQVSGRIAGTLIAGTLIGALVALAVHLFLGPWLPLTLQVALAAGICAVIASGRPTLRVCLWTCPLVLLTTSPAESPQLTAMSRSVEVLLGALIGGALHQLEAHFLPTPASTVKTPIVGGDD
ncbi:MAG: FUSC family protein [Rhodocyclaceae bacterium]